MPNRNDTPCYGCMDREQGCHSTCQSYIGWKESLKEISDLQALDRALDNVDASRVRKIHYYAWKRGLK